MKHTLIILTCLLQSALFGQTVKTLKTKPDKAIVYLSGAELSHSESVTLAAGVNEIILENVSPYADENSVSAVFKGSAWVIDAHKSVRYIEPAKHKAEPGKYLRELKAVGDSLEELEFLVKDAQNKQDALQKEKDLLLNNRLLKGEYSQDSIELLKASLDLMHSRLITIDEMSLALERKLSKYYKLQAALIERKEHYTILQENGSEIPGEEPKAIHQLIVTLSADQAVTGSLIVKYFIASAGWVPMYDIHAASGKTKIQLVYRAQVYQNSGLDWKDVALKLSTSNPAYTNIKPTLNAWSLYFYNPNAYNVPQTLNQYRYKLQNSNIATKDAEAKLGNAELSDSYNDDVAVPAPIFSVNDNFLNTEYDIKVNYSIATDNKPHYVVINSMDIPVALTYSSVPKLDKDAFLMGKISDWEDFNLVPGNAKIYFDESYIGQTVVDPVTTKDTLYINLGRDKSIMLKRMTVKEKSKEQVAGENKVVTRVVEITVRNTKAVSLPFEIEDQIPITGDASIKITLLDSDDAIYNEETGKLTWVLDVKAKDTKKIRFSYEIKYPKDKVITGI